MKRRVMHLAALPKGELDIAIAQKKPLRMLCGDTFVPKGRLPERPVCNKCVRVSVSSNPWWMTIVSQPSTTSNGITQATWIFRGDAQ